MEKLVIQAEELLKAIKRNEKDIDNPVLTMSMIAQLDDFIEYLKEEE